MAFSNPITGGQGALVRPSIKSPNFVAGTSGWIIRRDGSAEFNSVVVRGELESTNYVPGVSGWHLDPNGSAEFYEIVARGDLQSDNFVAGVSGWNLDEAGSAEFYDIVARGSLSTSESPPRITISEDGGGSFIAFDTTFPDEISSGIISCYSEEDTFPPVLSFTPPRCLAGPGNMVFFTITSPNDAGFDELGGFSFVGEDDGAGTSTYMALVSIDFYLRSGRFRIDPGSGVSPSGTSHPFQIGVSTGVNLRADGDEIQFANNGSAADGGINQDGGDVTFFANQDGDSDTVNINGGFSCNVIAVGQVAITPVANVISSVAVTGLGLYSGKAYRACATGNSSVPGEQGITGALYMVTANNATADGATFYILRNNTTQTFVYYIIAADDI